MCTCCKHPAGRFIDHESTSYRLASPLRVKYQALMLFVDDADAHCERARAAGARIEAEPKTIDYGDDYWIDRGYEAVDIEGHHGWFVQRVSDVKNTK